MLKLGTATITKVSRPNAEVFVVHWMNHGNFLTPEPRAFISEQEAIDWVNARSLRLVKR
jgi:hypothetical protein